MKITKAYKNLRADKERSVFPRQVPGAHFSYVTPEPVKNPELICWSKAMGDLRGIEPTNDWIQALSGNSLIEGMVPLSTRYGGHQFGHWAGQLGDGRAMTLGMIENQGVNFELQLKGAGLTPYSRSADGRAVLRSSLREFICSEAMASLGVPTTRALSLVTTGEGVVRDMFYDGHPEVEKGAICSRVAPSFLRFGHFQIHTSLNEKDQLKELWEFVNSQFYQNFSVEKFFEDVVNKTAFLITEWYRVGFVHGVMNTDNLSIHGLTIDYGPFGWMDLFDPDWTPNTTDFSQRRYRFMNQHNIAYWNLARLAEALFPLSSKLEPILEKFPSFFKSHMSEMMRKKLGLGVYDDQLTNKVFHLLTDLQGDMTLFYRSLLKELQGEMVSWKSCFYRDLSNDEFERVNSFIKEWKSLTGPDAEKDMMMANPIFIPRNYIIQLALDDLKKGSRETLDFILKAIENPYDENNYTTKYFTKRPDWAATKPGCSTLSCSS